VIAEPRSCPFYFSPSHGQWIAVRFTENTALDENEANLDVREFIITASGFVRSIL
jgi:hypothetical protein